MNKKIMPFWVIWGGFYRILEDCYPFVNQVGLWQVFYTHTILCSSRCK